MNKKLTLYLSEDIISRAKVYAKEKGTSVSGLVEDFLSKETSAYQSNSDVEVKVEDEFAAFCGVIELPEEIDEKELAGRIRQEKHR